MSVDNCQSKDAEPPGFIDTKSAGETHKLLPTRLAGKREVHMRMIGESLSSVYAVAHIAAQHAEIAVGQPGQRTPMAILFRCKRANARIILMQTAKIVRDSQDWSER